MFMVQYFDEDMRLHYLGAVFSNRKNAEDWISNARLNMHYAMVHSFQVVEVLVDKPHEQVPNIPYENLW